MVAQKLYKLTQARANENICSSDAQIIQQRLNSTAHKVPWLAALPRAREPQCCC